MMYQSRDSIVDAIYFHLLLVVLLLVVHEPTAATCYCFHQPSSPKTAFLGGTDATTKPRNTRIIRRNFSSSSSPLSSSTRIFSSSTSTSSSTTTDDADASSTSTSTTTSAAEKALEEWLLSTSPPPAAKLNLDCVEHATFGSTSCLRGLKWKDEKPLPTSRRRICEIPESKVISTNEPSANWDADLAIKLWEEYMKGSSSNYWGYLRLLTDTDDDDSGSPASVAPNALRHWSPNQLEILEESEAGRRLLQLNEKQQDAWKRKYNEIIVTDKNRIALSWEQFQWSMEVVHSRAFRGFTTTTTATSVEGGQGSNTNVALSLAAPVVAALVGVAYYMTIGSASAENEEFSTFVLAGLGIVAAIPLLLNLINGGGDSSQSGSTVSLLPFIDSANHLEGADSLNEYNPVTRCYELSVGPKSVDPETRQVFISYGKKSDAELLLNYGFLPGVDCADGVDDAARDRQRSALARAFCKRNN